jgi:transcription termination factor Rho
MEKQYDSMTLVTLRELAKKKGLKNIAALKKGELIEALINLIQKWSRMN